VEHPELLAILNRLVKVETSPGLRRETIRVLGVLGALDPYKRKVLFEKVDESANEHIRAAQTDISLLMHATGGQSNEDYFQAVVFNSLVGIVSDPALSALHYTKAMDAIVHIFLTQGLKCVSFLPQVIPAMLAAIRHNGPTYQGPWLSKLGTLISLVKQHIRNFLDPIFTMILEYWNNPSLQSYVIKLVGVTAEALEGEFKAFLPRLLQDILRTFDGDLSDPRRQEVLVEVLGALQSFGLSLEEYSHLILPAVIKLFDRADVGPAVREKSIETIGHLAKHVNFSEHASQIIHPLARVIGMSSPSVAGSMQLADTAMTALCSLVIQLGPEYAIFIPMMNKVLLGTKVSRTHYDQLVVKILKRERLQQDIGVLDAIANEAAAGKSATPAPVAVNQQRLKRAWGTAGVSTPEEWREWSKQLGLELLRESPSVALQACQDLAEEHESLNRELFNVAFISCWTSLYEAFQEDFVTNISSAISSPSSPAEVINLLLNLCEFAEHDDKVLPIDPKMLGRYALQHRAYAKALHYKELEWFTDPSADVVKALINVNSKLQQQDTAWGILTYARHYERWYLELNRWQEAYTAFDRKALEGEEDGEIIFGKMRCLHALGEWDQLSDYVQSKWGSVGVADHRQMASLAAAAAWALKQWDLMEDYVAVMKKDTPDYFFYRAVISIHNGQYPKAMRHILRARDSVDPELCSLFGESYSRAYKSVQDRFLSIYPR
jgi:FKBP12-rapamycin complex-associated protein